ncbi:alpha/beta fold hydrolase [Microbacterium sp. SLBN-146]|uniref:alpha/beta fold hydrolase n=1 Tax=Microbacterium sp. SLBN-146 TaxID=2768457 RepID=UPI00114E8847|nr:alpha/beta fold hydrolase [Microbacterium sp. SLBN-146]
MNAHAHRLVHVPVAGGDLRVGIWDPTGDERTADVLLIHGITSSHLAWSFVVERLPGVRGIAPDLRGRGGSNGLEGASGMRQHADDLAATLDALGIDQILAVGHSMGAFVAAVFAHFYPERVSRLVLVDGGLPLDVPQDLDAGALVSAILGPTAARLSMRFPDTRAYLDFWRQHPAFGDEWPAMLEEYFAYDLVDDGAGALRPATSYQTTVEDTVDMNTGTAVPEAIEGLRHPARLITTSRGLQNEEPGLYAPEHLERMLAQSPAIRHQRVAGLNHYTIVLSDAGADLVAAIIQEELALS